MYVCVCEGGLEKRDKLEKNAKNAGENKYNHFSN